MSEDLEIPSWADAGPWTTDRLVAVVRAAASAAWVVRWLPSSPSIQCVAAVPGLVAEVHRLRARVEQLEATLTSGVQA